MRIGIMLRYAGAVLLLDAFFMLISALFALLNGFDTGFYPLLLSFIVTTILGFFPMIFVPSGEHVSSKEGYVVVMASWLTSCVIGMLPYLIWGGEFSVVNAFFESTSGYSATGATILNDIEALPKSLLLWRSFTIWMGGVGVVLFALVVLPSFGRSKMTLSNVELTSLAKNNFKYNTKQILRIIVTVYVGLTLIQAVLLAIAGMGIFDSFCHALSTMATGGFSTRNLSIMHFNNVWVEIIMMVFMVIGGLHFGLIYATIKGKKTNIFNSEIVRFYLIVLLVGGSLVSLDLFSKGLYDSIGESVRHGFFQVISYNTSSGFTSSDNSNWPPFSMLILIYLSIQCATAGSTTGGLKADRVLLLLKSIKARILKLQHPNAVIRIKLEGQTQEDSAVNAAVLLISFYLLAIFVSTLVFAICDYDLLTSFTVSVASICNIGPGFGKVSNMQNMSFFSDGLKLWISFLMLFGRMELFGLIHLFLIRSWK